MLEDINIRWIALSNNKVIRKWIVSSIQFDFESNGSYCYKKLVENEYCEFGSPFPARVHAMNLVRKYKKQYSDVMVIIREEYVK